MCEHLKLYSPNQLASVSSLYQVHAYLQNVYGGFQVGNIYSRMHRVVPLLFQCCPLKFVPSTGFYNGALHVGTFILGCVELNHTYKPHMVRNFMQS